MCLPAQDVKTIEISGSVLLFSNHIISVKRFGKSQPHFYFVTPCSPDSPNHLSRLQLVQNFAARLYKKRSHISSVLDYVHWFPISDRNDFIILTLSTQGITSSSRSILTGVALLTNEDLKR